MSPAPGSTHALAAFAVEAEFDESARRAAVSAFVDTLAATVVGVVDKDADPVSAFVRADRSDGPCTALGLNRSVSAPAAALVNGTVGHIADYDDVSHALQGHPSGILVPALLATAERCGAGGRAVLDAYWAGFRVALATAAGMDLVAHYRRGWHSTSTIGALAATAAVARLQGLDVDATRNALGLAASFAAGSRQNFGTTTKALHVGRTAELAITAVDLVGAGATADPDQLEGPLGYFTLLGGGPVDVAALLATLHDPPDAAVTVKMYPCCFQAHRAVDAALAVNRELSGRAIAHVEVTVQPGGAAALIHDRPRTPLEAKFSAPYIVATALLDGQVGVSEFTNAALQDPARRTLLEHVVLREAEVPPRGTPEWRTGYAVVNATLVDGTHVSSRCDAPRGHPSNPPSEAEVWAKFADCFRYAGLDAITEAAAEAIAALLDNGPADAVLTLMNDALVATVSISREA